MFESCRAHTFQSLQIAGFHRSDVALLVAKAVACVIESDEA
jgi:hypothetical protein